jgi:hypothetical protein
MNGLGNRRTESMTRTMTAAALLLAMFTGCGQSPPPSEGVPIVVPTGPPPPAPEITDAKLTPIDADGPHRFPLRRVVGDTANYSVERYTTVESAERTIHHHLKGKIRITVVGVEPDGDMTQVWIVGDFDVDPNTPPEPARIYKLQSDNYRIDLRIPANYSFVKVLNDEFIHSRFTRYLDAVAESERKRHPSVDPDVVEASPDELKNAGRLLKFAVPEATWFFDVHAKEFPPDGREVITEEKPLNLGEIGGSGVIPYRSDHEWIVEGIDATRSLVTIRRTGKINVEEMAAASQGKLPDKTLRTVMNMFSDFNFETIYQLDMKTGWPAFAQRTYVKQEQGNKVTRLHRLRRIAD